MNSQDYKNIWVVFETVNNEVKKVSLELLNQGKTLAEATDEQVVAVIVGQHVDEAVKTAMAYGADEVLVVEGAEYKDYRTDSFSNALVKLIEKYKPSAVMMGATNNGRDLLSRVAARLHVGSAADCLAVEIGDKKTLAWTRSVYSGKLLNTVSFPNTRPQIGTVRSSTYERGQADETKVANVIREEIQTPLEQIRTTVKEIIKSVGEGVKLEDAEVVIGGGRGLGKSENVELIKELASVLGGTIGTTRACIDAGWVPYSLQIGQSGKRVSPKLYIACGISGATQHLAGITSSEVIVAINKDPDAPIFEIADYGVVGDLVEIVPILIEEIKKLKAS